MLTKLRARLTYANVMATLGVFIALGGTAYAVNTIGSSDVIDDSLLSQDIKNQTVGTADLAIDSVWGSRIRDNAILSAHVVDSTLTGSDILESSLKAARTVARARNSSATSADGGVSNVNVPLTGNTWTQLNDETDQFFGEVVVTEPAVCTGGGGTTVTVKLGADSIASLASNSGFGPHTLRFSTQARVSPGTDTARTLTATLTNNCTGPGEFTSVDSLKVDVLGTR